MDVILKYNLLKVENASKLIRICIGCTWLINGLFCKVFNLVPRHEEIVSAILGTSHSRALTIAIGLAETGMAIWIFSGKKTALNAITQVAIIASMNILEFLLVPHLLLWGKMNAVFAFLLITIIICNQFFLTRKKAGTS